ncbi:TonB-dependent receptor domain-containing protein [Sphingomonas silueang]|uniref:TonB-dependent receptor domain-containing protein n=1 Tax=Sphingomonas silueang TaxID=3156617 RepID=UPI0032B5A8F2
MLLASASIVAGLIAGTGPAFAQTSATAPVAAAAASEQLASLDGAAQEAPVALAAGTAQPAEEPGEDIVVTGSLIARPDYQANSPIVSVGAEAIAATGQITVERALSQMPQFAGGLGQSNTSTTGTGLNGGQANASLRGLGSKRTLILLDGKRLQPSNPDGSIDLNTIPEALISNIEVITGGASTTYGSDATAGVVNFRLKRDFSGLALRAFTGITNYGDGANFRVTATGGGQFDDDRGRAFVSLDYSRRDRAKQAKRPWYPERQYCCGANEAIPYAVAYFPGNLPTLASVNALLATYGAAPLVPTSTATTGQRNSYAGEFGFNNDGTLFTTNGVPVRNFRGVETDEYYLIDESGSPYVGQGKQFKFGFRGGDIQSEMERYMAMGRVDYDVTDAISVFGQFSYTTYMQDSIVNTTLSNNFYTPSIPYNSVLIPNDLKAVLASRPNPTGSFASTKSWQAIGNRGQSYKYNVWQFMTGADGELGIGDLRWEAYATTSAADFYNGQTGGLSASRLMALFNSPTGQVSTCTDFRYFGDFPISQGCSDYLTRDTLNTTNLRQTVVQGTLAGSLVELPAGKVKFAVGSDYRSNSFTYKADEALNQPQGTSYFADGGSDIIGFASLRSSQGEVKVKEVFGELFVPVLYNTPLIQELSLDLGYRFSDYDSIGGTHTYKVDFAWAVVDEVRFRGGYNRAIRAPSPGELFAPVSNSSTGIGTAGATAITGDPCDRRSQFRLQNPTQVRALCLAQGITPAAYDSFAATSQVFPLTGGNPDLDEEVADTYSIGVILGSPFDTPLLRDLKLSVDYYDIKIRDAIGTLGITQIVQSCFNVGGTNPTFSSSNYFCQLLGQRQANGELGAGASQPLLNLGQFQVAGVDAQLDWRLRLDEIGLGEGAGTFSVRSVVSYLDKFKIQDRPGQPFRNFAGTIGRSIEANAGVSHPRWKANTGFNYDNDGFDIGLTWIFIDRMKHSNTVATPTATTPGIKAYSLFNLNIGFDLKASGVSIALGSANIFNTAPPTYSDNIPTYDGQLYDIVGRTFFASLSKKF